MQKYSFSILCLIIICFFFSGCTRKESAKENAIMQMKIKVYSKLIEINPNDPGNASFYMKRSNAYHKLGDSQKAKNDENKYRELIQKLSDSTIDPGNLSGYMNKVSQQRENIIAVCDEIISSDPVNYPAPRGGASFSAA